MNYINWSSLFLLKNKVKFNIQAFSVFMVFSGYDYFARNSNRNL